jgi:hypothetical protein
LEVFLRKLKWFEKMSDADLWGIGCALQHAIQSGYFNATSEDGNLDWAVAMMIKINHIRDMREEKK